MKVKGKIYIFLITFLVHTFILIYNNLPLHAFPAPFDQYVTYQTIEPPSNQTSGDINQDGYPDLVTTSVRGNKITIYINQGDGSFSKSEEHETGERPLSPTIGDLNQDGYPDLAIVDRSSRILSIYLNNGNGSFTDNIKYGCSLPDKVLMGDLDQDGCTDLVVMDDRDIKIFMNQGNADFIEEDRISRRIYPLSLQDINLKDVNYDGCLDIIGTEYSEVYYYLAVPEYDPKGTVFVYMNKGDGSFENTCNCNMGWNLLISSRKILIKTDMRI